MTRNERVRADPPIVVDEMDVGMADSAVSYRDLDLVVAEGAGVEDVRRELAPCEGAAYDLIDMSGSDWGAVESKMPLGAR